jgi:hypothetical protein
MDFQPNPNHQDPAHHGPHQPDHRPHTPGRSDDELFCPNCGKTIKKGTAFCVHCGAQVGQAAPSPTAQAAPGYAQAYAPAVPVNPDARDKVVAILLAVFVGFFAWLYTYRKDKWKFWLNLGLSIITLSLWAFVAWIWVIIDVAVRPESFFRNYPNES